MHNKTSSIVLACALGACIGAFSALEIASRFEYGSFLWIVGALLGGVVSYITINFRGFCLGVVYSYDKTLAWRPNRLYWGAVGMVFIGVLSLLSNTLPFLIIGLSVAKCFQEPSVDIIGMLQSAWEDRNVVINWIIFAMTMATTLSFLVNARDNKGEREYKDSLFNLREIGYKWLVRNNVFVVTLWAVHYVSKKLCQFVVNSPRFAKMVFIGFVALVVEIAQFVAGVFVYVHSSQRTLCFVNATLGAATGYFLGSTFIGACAGAILGFVSHKLVSVCWLQITSR